jgi:hypothetical protein
MEYGLTLSIARLLPQAQRFEKPRSAIVGNADLPI